MKATLDNFRQSPRKVRLVADAIRGASVARARSILAFMDQKSASAMCKLVESATANARQRGVSNPDNLVITRICVDQGLTLKRWMPRARGRATGYRKRMSRINLELSDASTENTENKRGAAHKPHAGHVPSETAAQ